MFSRSLFSIGNAIGLALGWCLLIQTAAVFGHERLPDTKADETGMVPGDIVFGNMNTYPGHCGIYIGKWKDLPEALRTKYQSAFDNVLIRSRDEGLKTSFLVVDSDGGRGCRLSSFVEQFTNYLPKGARGPDLKGALKFESDNGGAVAWKGLATDDERRWKIIEEALKAAAARVPYEDKHMQWETTRAGGTAYENMSGLDCISLIHVAYWRGAEIDLDVSWFPWHEPSQLFTAAKDERMMRSDVDLKPVHVEAAIAGNWKIAFALKSSNKDFNFNGEFVIGANYSGDKLNWVMLDPTTMQPPGESKPLDVPVKATSASDGGVDIEVLDKSQTRMYSSFTFKVNADGSLLLKITGTDDDGPYQVAITGSKLRG